ncbi:basic proline-rich protein-like [Choloepus didactylus]|uniref:basic proline-rich protein-like n=1 Tax=Choloepus didactylus TaxID=27675 RepID=UPI00189F9265|nr:basic proline-rich protein-like [Choloepus didactylus]
MEPHGSSGGRLREPVHARRSTHEPAGAHAGGRVHGGRACARRAGVCTAGGPGRSGRCEPGRPRTRTRGDPERRAQPQRPARVPGPRAPPAGRGRQRPAEPGEGETPTGGSVGLRASAGRQPQDRGDPQLSPVRPLGREGLRWSPRDPEPRCHPRCLSFPRCTMEVTGLSRPFLPDPCVVTPRRGQPPGRGQQAEGTAVSGCVTRGRRPQAAPKPSSEPQNLLGQRGCPKHSTDGETEGREGGPPWPASRFPSCSTGDFSLHGPCYPKPLHTARLPTMASHPPSLAPPWNDLPPVSGRCRDAGQLCLGAWGGRGPQRGQRSVEPPVGGRVGSGNPTPPLPGGNWAGKCPAGAVGRHPVFAQATWECGGTALGTPESGAAGPGPGGPLTFSPTPSSDPAPPSHECAFADLPNAPPTHRGSPSPWPPHQGHPASALSVPTMWLPRGLSCSSTHRGSRAPTSKD